MVHSVRRRDQTTYDFETGLAIAGVDLSAADGAKAFGLKLPNDPQLRTLYDWLVQAKARLDGAQQAVAFASNATAIAGVSQTELISPSNLKAVVDSVVGPAPTSLNTFAEFVASINADPSFAANVFALFALKAPLASPAFTGPVTSVTPGNAGNPKQVVNIGFLEAMITDLLLGLKPAPGLPVLVGNNYAVIDSTYTLELSSTPSDPALHIATFEVSVNGAPPVVIAAANDSAVFNWTVSGTAGQTATFTVLAKDTKNKYSSAATLQVNLIAELIAHPVILTPATNAANQSTHPVITTSTFTPMVGTDTHASTDWTIRLVSSNQVVYQSLADAVNLTSLSVPADVLLTSREYEVTVVYTGTTLGSSGAGVSRFVTSYKRPAPTFIAPAGWVRGSNLTFQLNGQALLAAPETTIPTTIYVGINSTDQPIPFTNPVQSYSAVIPAASIAETVPGQVTLFVWTVWGETGISQVDQYVIPVVQAQTPTVLFPTQGSSDIPVRPSFTASAYSSNVAGDVFDHAIWVLRDSSGAVVASTSQSTQNAWPLAHDLDVNTQYTVQVTQFGVINTAGVSATSTFTTTLQAQFKMQYWVRAPIDASFVNSSSYMPVSAARDGTSAVYGMPAVVENRIEQGSNVSVPVGRLESYINLTVNGHSITSPAALNSSGVYARFVGTDAKVSGDGLVYATVSGSPGGVTIVDALASGQLSAGTWSNLLTIFALPAFTPRSVVLSETGQTIVTVEADSNNVSYIRTHKAQLQVGATVDFCPREEVGAMFPSSYTDPADQTVYAPHLSGGAPVKLALSADGLVLAIGMTYRAVSGFNLISMVTIRRRASVNDTAWSQGVVLVGTVVRGLLLGQQHDWLALSGDGNVLAFSGAYTNTGGSQGKVEIYRYASGAWSKTQELEGAPVWVDPTNTGTLAIASTRSFGYNVALDRTGSTLLVGFELNRTGTIRYDVCHAGASGDYTRKGWVIGPSYGPVNLNSATDKFGRDCSISLDGMTLYATDVSYVGISGVACGGILAFNIGSY